MPKIELPPSLVSAAGGERTVSLDPGDLASLIRQLRTRYPDVHRLIASGEGLKPFVRLFVNGRPLNLPIDAGIHVGDDAQVRLVIAVAGG